MSRRPISGVVARRLPICVLVKKIGCISISLPRMRRDGLGWVVGLRLVGRAVYNPECVAFFVFAPIYLITYLLQPGVRGRKGIRPRAGLAKNRDDKRQFFAYPHCLYIAVGARIENVYFFKPIRFPLARQTVFCFRHKSPMLL